MAKQKRRGTIERLEARYALTQFGIPWPAPQQLTFSFVPDGTLVAGDQTSVADNQTSDLFASLNDAPGAGNWQAALMQALQTWAANTNVNFGLVPDGGEPLGTPGLAEGDPRFGDIRFAAAPLSSDVVALGTPFSFAAGTLSGDIVFNSNYQFGEGANAQYDLFSVALHEAGHVLGLPDSTDPTSAMCPQYLGVRDGLSAADITAVDAVYGTRPLDTSNQTLANATLLSPTGDSSAAVVDAQLANASDTHYYQYPVVDNEDATIVLHTAGVSLVEPQLTVYDSSGNIVASAVSASVNGGDLLVHVHNQVGNPTLVINVSSATSGVFGVGAYRLAAVSGPSVPNDLLQGPAGGGDGSGSDDGGSNGSETGGGANAGTPSTGSTSSISTTGTPSTGTPSTGTRTPSTGSQSDSSENDGSQSGSGGGDGGSNAPPARNNYSFHSTLVAPADVQYMHVTVPAASGSGPMTLTATISVRRAGGAAPMVTVSDGSGQSVPAQVLENANGTYSLQVVGVTPGAVYTLAVSAADPAGSAAVGSYRLAVNFDSTPVALTSYASGTLTATANQQFQVLQLHASQFFHFLLSATSSAASSAPAAVRMTIYDTLGNVVQSMVSHVGSTLSTTLLLEPGTYVFRLAAGTQDGSPLPDAIYQLQGADLSDPIGPTPVTPVYTPPPPPPPIVFSIPIIPFYLSFLTSNDQYGTPYGG